jgi:nicotinamidase/pyrazinamidase
MVNTWESEFITGFVSEKVDEIFVKWDNIAEHTYSAFTWKNRNNVGLEAYMHKEWIGRAFVQSLTLDFCVKETALSSVKAGFDTYLIEWLSRGVYPNTTKDALEEMQDNWVTIIK